MQYGVAGLDGCAPEHSVPVKVSGQPGRLSVPLTLTAHRESGSSWFGPRRSSTPTACSACSRGSLATSRTCDGRVDAACVLAAGLHGFELLTVAAV
jgi:hypothetical protein